jgi:hypothetical protein
MWYMFPLPIVVQCWKKLGVKSIIIIIGSEEGLNAIPVYAYMLGVLKYLGVST